MMIDTNLWPAPDTEITIKSGHFVDGLEIRGKRVYKGVICGALQCVVCSRQAVRPQEAIFQALEKVINDLSDERCEEILHNHAIFEHVLGDGES